MFSISVGCSATDNEGRLVFKCVANQQNSRTIVVDVSAGTAKWVNGNRVDGEAIVTEDLVAISFPATSGSYAAEMLIDRYTGIAKHEHGDAPLGFDDAKNSQYQMQCNAISERAL